MEHIYKCYAQSQENILWYGSWIALGKKVIDQRCLSASSWNLSDTAHVKFMPLTWLPSNGIRTTGM